MNLIIYSLILFAVAFGEIFSQNFEAPIKNVLVYSDRAQVTRKTKLNVQPGEITYKVTELPAVLSDETLQASFPGEKNLRVSSVNSYIELTNSYNDASLDELKNQIESHEKTRKRIISNLENIRAEKSGVSGFENLTVDTISRQAAYSRSEAELPNWKESLSFFRRKNLEIERELHENEISLIRTEESLRILNLKLDSIISKSGKSKRITEIKISNSSKLPVSSELLISYIVPNSSWKPVYNISKTGKNLIEIEYLAEIYQESGENWKNVKIALSTAEPKKAQGRPRIRSQELYNITTEKKSENLFTYRREANAPATEAEKPVAETEPGNAPSVDGEVA
ncbi:MAG: mucoidy inhibitor MuiA family protein, partial [Leptospira sp.]|nr:mucoidy inhibitor MuiA family protein [Leptospira sp.]